MWLPGLSLGRTGNRGALWLCLTPLPSPRLRLLAPPPHLGSTWNPEGFLLMRFPGCLERWSPKLGPEQTERSQVGV